MKRMVRAGLALGMSVCLAVTAMAVPADVSAKKKTSAPKKITLNKKSVKIQIGKKFTVKVKKVTPKKASKKASAFKFKSSKTKIATVTKKGVIKGKKAGSCKVTVTSKTKKKVKATIKVTVIKKVVPQPTSAPPVVPATNAPVVSTTNPPAGTTTDAPATNPPGQETKAPATDAPATDVPATKAPATDVPATNAPATDAPATNAPATDVPATNVPVTNAPATNAPVTEAPATEAPVLADDEKDVDGVICKSFKLDTSKNYTITAEKANGSVEKVELPLSELPALLNKVVDPASTYEKWMTGTGYRKIANGVSVKVDTPDDSQMQTKVVTVKGSDNARVDGKFEVTIMKEGAVYTVNAKRLATGTTVTAVITDGDNDVVITGDYNGKSYRAVALKDKSNVKVYDKTSGALLGQIEKTEAGYDLDIEKGRAESRKVEVEENTTVRPDPPEDPDVPEEPAFPEGSYSLPLNSSTTTASLGELEFNEDGVTISSLHPGGGVSFNLPADAAEGKKYDTVTINYKALTQGAASYVFLLNGNDINDSGVIDFNGNQNCYPATSGDEVKQVVFKCSKGNVTGYKLINAYGGSDLTVTITGIAFSESEPQTTPEDPTDKSYKMTLSADTAVKADWWFVEPANNTYNADGSVTFALPKDGNKAIGFNFNADGSAFDLSDYKEAEITLVSDQAGVAARAGFSTKTNLGVPDAEMKDVTIGTEDTKLTISMSDLPSCEDVRGFALQHKGWMGGGTPDNPTITIKSIHRRKHRLICPQ